MPIEEELLAPRNTIAWSGSPLPAPATAAFVSHEFAIVPLRPSTAGPSGMPLVTTEVAVVFTDTGKAGTFAQRLKLLAPYLLSRGCGVLAIARSVRHLENELAGAKLPYIYGTVAASTDTLFHPYIYIIDATTPSSPWNTLANRALDWAKEPIPTFAPDLQLTIPKGTLSEDEILLRRAFWDASVLHLEAMTEGKSGASVFSAHAKLSFGWAAPLFLKMGDRGEIIKEYKVYRDRVDLYVPFHLGPGLAGRRCCLGATRGLLVGDFVEESESLLACAKGGRASGAISSLFQRGLRGLHGRRPTVSQQTIGAYLASRSLLLPELGASLEKRAVRLGGKTCAAAQLNTRIIRAFTNIGYVEGWIHADLNARNIRVRSADAVLIDFARSELGPLLLDAAALEASLLVSGGPSSLRGAANWRASIGGLYGRPLEMAPPRPDPADKWSWFHDCVRQIRMHAREVELGNASGQYAIALAWALAGKACKDEEFHGAEADARAFAYVLADRVLS
jgi:hypothetical protein